MCVCAVFVASAVVSVKSCHLLLYSGLSLLRLSCFLGSSSCWDSCCMLRRLPHVKKLLDLHLGITWQRE